LGELFLIPVPLSTEQNLECLTRDTIEISITLKNFFCEDLRTSRRFLRKCGYTGDFSDINFCQIGEKTREEPDAHLDRILSGISYGLLSESGMPCIADPGNTIVLKAHELGIKVRPLPGPNSILLTLAGSGLNGQHFTFNGYLPIKSHERKAALKKLEERSLRENSTQLFIETPYRNNAMLLDIIQTCAPESILCIGLDLTLPQEEILTLTIADWRKLHKNIEKRFSVFALHVEPKRKVIR
jgi:16S rRNA (cytidine1402-2'-O)-methyltransferase